MRPLAIATLALAALAPPAASYSGYTYSRAITVAGAVVPSAQANFPMLVYGTYNYLATTGSGGYIQNTVSLNSQTVPADLIFTSDAGCATPLNWEVASYTATTGQLQAWVRVPSLSNGAVIYMCYDNAAVTTYRGSPTSAWDGNFMAVWHYPNGSSLSTNDSTANGINAASSSGASAGSGEVDGALALSGSSSGINYGTPSAIPTNFATANTGTTYCAWVNVPSQNDSIVQRSDNNVQVGWLFYIGASRFPTFQLVNTGADLTVAATTAVAASTWTHVCAVATYVSTTESVTMYVNGVAAGSGSKTGSQGTDNTQILYVGKGNLVGALAGSIDEIRISSTNRSANWIATEYNNQSSPSTFYTMGPAMSMAAFGAGTAIIIM
jgi:hypothetical protein